MLQILRQETVLRALVNADLRNGVWPSIGAA